MREADIIESRACRRHVVEGGGPGRQIEQSVLEWLAEASGRLACKLLSISCVVFVWSASALAHNTKLEGRGFASKPPRTGAAK